MDVREAILARLVVIAGTIDGVSTVQRNNLNVSETAITIVVFDGDEKADEDDPPARGPKAPRRMIMLPQLLITLPEKARDVGTVLNAFRAKLIHAVLFDNSLTALTWNGRGARLAATQTSLAWGRTMMGEMGVSFAIPYLLRPDQLVETTA